MFSSDPVIDYLHHEMVQEQKLARLPVCSVCGNHIQDDYALFLWGEWICQKCVEENQAYVDDYAMEETEEII